ncbi:hypothetical protein [Commensalibacter oyaizuii]|uniref:Uncharacterized protein n=1 Tax=Commensalibacter oyaizuii TaxID=3043873 RepID=A0ABT6Q5D0_9PROT|nr:hypothetical protein [Commensalibacter sp. TBRC 16381]MDI2091679.1 hypothetical protein [Commensalibacter sp. TBRC 16381]
MKIHDLVRGMIATVNPNIIGSIYRSKGYALNGTQQEPLYEDPVQVELQIQSLLGDVLKHSHFLNQQGERKVVYVNGQVFGIDRVRGAGGDLLEFYGRRWLVVQRLESWEGSDWCKVVVVAQLDKPQDDDAIIEDYVE